MLADHSPPFTHLPSCENGKLNQGGARICSMKIPPLEIVL